MSRVLAALLFVLAAGLTAYPPLLALAEDGTLGAFRYLAADSFYYLTVATRSVGAEFFTFDGLHPTNGFHPLWQVLLERSFAWLSPGSAGRVYLALGAGIALVSVGMGLLAVAVLRITGRPALALLAAVPGPFFALVPGTGSGVGAPWSYANGMESPLSVFFFGLLLALLTGRSAFDGGRRSRGLLVASVLLTLLTLSRLDDVFLFAPFLLYVVFRERTGSRKDVLQRVVLAAAIPTVVLAGYLAYNLVSAGSLLPSSGASKAAPLWALARNGYAVVTTLAPFLDVFGRGAGLWSGESWRVAQMLVPALAAGAWLAVHGVPAMGRRCAEGRMGWHESVVGLLAVYVVLKAGYNFTTVGLWHQGHWYYPVSIMTSNLIVASAASRWLGAAAPSIGSREGSYRRRGGRSLALVAAGAYALWSASAFADQQREERPRDRRHAFWAEREEVGALLARECSGCGVLSFDDGIIAYSLPETPTLNGLGLTMDVEALRARREGRLLDLAWERGVRLIASVSYEMPEEAFSNAASLRSHLDGYPHLEGQDLEPWRFEVAFESPASGVRFVRFGPR